MGKIRAAILLTTASSLAAVVIFLVWGQSLIDRKILEPSVFKLTYQFCLLVVAGGAVSWLYRELTRLREKEDRDRHIFRELHSDLVAAYNAYKRTKRLLRARAWRTGDLNDLVGVDLLRVEAYCTLVEELNETQLLLESMVRRVEGRNELFRRVDALYEEPEGGGLAGDITALEKYLNKVVQEYERALRSFKEDPEYLPLRDLPVVSEFIASGGKSSDRRVIAAKSFHRALKKLSEVAEEGL